MPFCLDLIVFRCTSTSWIHVGEWVIQSVSQYWSWPAGKTWRLVFFCWSPFDDVGGVLGNALCPQGLQHGDLWGAESLWGVLWSVQWPHEHEVGCGSSCSQSSLARRRSVSFAVVYDPIKVSGQVTPSERLNFLAVPISGPWASTSLAWSSLYQIVLNWGSWTFGLWVTRCAIVHHKGRRRQRGPAPCPKRNLRWHNLKEQNH